MIKKIDVNKVHSDIDEDVVKYLNKKIGKLDSYMPRHARKSARAEAILKESKSDTKKESTCEVSLIVPGSVLTAHETSINMYAAIDIVEEKLKSQLRKYKELNDVTKSRGNIKIRAMFGKVVGK